jgi:hypothetical protein
VFHCSAVSCGGSTGSLLATLIGATLVVMVPDPMATTNVNCRDPSGAPGAVLVRVWLPRGALAVGGDGFTCVACDREGFAGVARPRAPVAAGAAEPGCVPGSAARSAVVHPATPSVTAPTTAAATTTLRVATTAS